MSFENGHLSPTDEPTYATLDTKPSHSESELSDVNDIPDHTVPESIDHVMQDAASPRSDEDEDADGSDDADYDAPSPPSRASVDSRHSSVSSEASSLPRKRKAEPDVDDEQYMQENPELYGLRRSVSRLLVLFVLLPLTVTRVAPVLLAESCVSLCVVIARIILTCNCRSKAATKSKTTTTLVQTSTPAGPVSVYGRPPLAMVSQLRPLVFFVVTDIHVLLVSARQTDSESGTDSDTYGGARGREFAKRHRRRLQGASSRSASGLAGDLRFSTRQAGKVTTYNEEDGDDFSEEDIENLTPNYWAAAEDDSPGIDVVLNHRIADGKGEARCILSFSSLC